MQYPLANFYRREESEFYLNPIDFHIMTDEQLAQRIASGIRLYDSLYPPSISPIMIIGLVVVCVAAVAAVAAAGAAAAGGGAAAGTAGAAASTTAVSAAAPGLTSVAATTGASASSIMSKIQSVAKYVNTAGKVYAKATGKNPPDKLMATADIVGSGSVSGAVKAGVSYQLKQQGMKIDRKDKNAQAALDVMVQREQEKYSASLRKVAEQESKRLNVPITPPPPPPSPISARDVIGFGLPVVLFLLGSRG